MTSQRYRLLEQGDAELTPEEISQGYHFCLEFDGLLIGPGCSELDCCHCLPKDHPVYQTIPQGPPAPIELPIENP